MPALEARRESCDAMVIFMSSGEVIKLTKLGKFRMDAPTGAVVNLLKKLRGGKAEDAGDKAKAGARQLQMLKRVPKILRFIPGTAQDVRAYFLTMQYWLAGSEDNMADLVRFLASRYGDKKVLENASGDLARIAGQKPVIKIGRASCRERVSSPV